MDSTQESSPSFRCFDNFLNPENWETYRLPADVTSFEDESLAGDDEYLTSEVQEEDAEKQGDGDVSPVQNPVIDELEDVIKSLEKANFKPRRRFYKTFEISPEIIKCKFKSGFAEEVGTLEGGKCFTNTDEEKNNLIINKLKEDGVEESVKKQNEDISNKNDNPEEEIVSSSGGQDISEMLSSVDEENMEVTNEPDDDKDDDGDEPSGDGVDNSCPWLTSDSGLGFNKAAVFLGLTSGSLLTGFSIGWMVGAKEGQCWLSSAVSSVVVRRVWDSVGMVIITGMVGNSLLGLSSYNFWFRKEKK